MPVNWKLTTIGLLWAVLLGLVSMLLLPLYVLPLGFVWAPVLAFLYVRYGKIPAYSAAGLLCVAGYMYGNVFGALFVAITAAVTVFALTMALRPDVKLQNGVLTVLFAMLFCIIAALVVFQSFYGDLVSAFVSIFRQIIELVPELKATYEELFRQLYSESYTLEMMFYDLEYSMRMTLPSQILTYCIYGAAFSVLAGLRMAARMGQTERFGAYDQFYNWSLPKYMGRTLAIGAGVCYLISMTASALYGVANTLWKLFYALFVLQGMASMAFSMKMRGRSKAFRTTITLLLFILFKPALFIAGLFDRISPLRKMLRMRSVTEEQTSKQDEDEDSKD